MHPNAPPVYSSHFLKSILYMILNLSVLYIFNIRFLEDICELRFSVDRIEESYNAYIKVPVDIPEEITQLTGIDKSKCQTIGIEMKDELDKYNQAYIHADWYKYNLIWKKNKTTQFLLTNYRPMKCTEDIYVFQAGSW